MHPRRKARFDELICHTISRLVLTLKDPAMGFVTITGARVTEDVSTARIFYSVFGSNEEKEATKEALERAKPYIRHELAQIEHLRRVPQLVFVYDSTVEEAARVNEILHTLKEEKDKPSS